MSRIIHFFELPSFNSKHLIIWNNNLWISRKAEKVHFLFNTVSLLNYNKDSFVTKNASNMDSFCNNNCPWNSKIIHLFESHSFNTKLLIIWNINLWFSRISKKVHFLFNTVSFLNYNKDSYVTKNAHNTDSFRNNNCP